MTGRGTTERHGSAQAAPITWHRSIPTVHLVGEIDLVVADQVTQSIAAACAVPGDVEIDLSEASFVDVQSLGSIAKAARSLDRRGHKLILIGASPLARRVLEALDVRT